MRLSKLWALPALLLFSSLLHAQGGPADHPYFSTRHSVSVGATYQEADSEVSASVANLPEISVGLDDLGVGETDTSFLVEYRGRFGEKWGLVAAAYKFSNSGSIGASKDFNFDGVEFEAGVDLDTSIDIDTYIVDAMYSVYKGERSELFIGGGLHVIDFSMEIEGKAFVGDLVKTDQTGASDLLAPLPNLRLQGFYALTQKLGLGLTAGWLSANYDQYDGAFTYAHLRGVYRFTQHFAAAIGYQHTGIDLTYERSSQRETKLDIDFDGPTVQLTYAF